MVSSNPKTDSVTQPLEEPKPKPGVPHQKVKPTWLSGRVAKQPPIVFRDGVRVNT